MGRMEMLARMMAEVDGENQGNVLTNEERAKFLQDRFAEYTTEHTFKPGDLVTPKHSFGTKSKPGVPVVVVAVDVPDVRQWCSDIQLGANHGGEPLTMLIGTTKGDGDFDIYAATPARFEPYNP